MVLEMIKKIIYILLTITTFGFKISAQEQTVMNLQQMLEFAKQNNYQIKDANIQKLKSEATLKEVIGNGLPQIKSEIDYKHYESLPVSVLDGASLGMDYDIVMNVGRPENVDASVQFSQLLFSLEYINGVKTAKKAIEINKLNKQQADEEMTQLLLKEYYNLIAIYKNLEIINSTMTSLSQMKNKINSLVDGGLALKTDLDKIAVNYSNMEANKTQILSAIKVQTNNLKYIIGMEAGENLTIDTTGFHNLFQTPLKNISDNENLDFNNLTEIQLLDKSLDLYKLKIKTEQAKKYPNLALYGSFMYQAKRYKFNFTDTNQSWYDVQLIGVKATIPIFSGLSKNSKIKQAKFDYNLTENKKQKAISGLQLQYMNAVMQYNTSISNCNIQYKNIEVAREVRKQEEAKYNEGLSTLTDVLIAEKDLRNAEINYAKNVIVTKQAEVDLLKTKGLLVDFQILDK